MLAENLVWLRRRFGYSQEEVAERVGVSRQAVTRWEAGETVPDLPNCVALAKLYDVKLDDLVRHDKESSGMAIPPKGKHIFGVVSLDEAGRVSLPQEARDLFQLRPGTSMLVLGDEEQGIALVPAEFFTELASAVLAAERREPDDKKNDGEPGTEHGPEQK
jgi:AbrB family looped-hinge helix DNA binding protein